MPLIKRISPGHASTIFVGFTTYFFILLYTVHPFLVANFDWNPVLNWFVTGYFLFMPIFVYATICVKREGHDTLPMMLKGLSIKTMSPRDWKYSLVGLALIFLLTGLIFGAGFLMSKHLGIRELSTTPWFVQLSPLQGMEKLLLLVWMPMFFFNIVGEEILWRGYIQKRISAKYGWLLCSFLWLIFHLPFGIDLMIMLLPIVIVVPYVFHRTQSTLACIFIHGVYNGPLFVAVAFGAI